VIICLVILLALGYYGLAVAGGAGLAVRGWRCWRCGAGGAGLDQIQLSLGNASMKSTEQYLEIEQDLTEAPCDNLGLRI
jgi:hypothetical protein